jgi:hypothetical protein
MGKKGSYRSCTISQARKLRELGIDQGMSRDVYNLFRVSGKSSVYYNGGPSALPLIDSVDAFDAGELGVMLPSYMHMQKIHDSQWKIYDEDGLLTSEVFKGTQEAQVRADMLIWLIENNRIKVKDCNNRLNQATQL